MEDTKIKIKELQELGIKLSALAKRANISLPSLSNFMADRRGLGKDAEKRLVDVLKNYSKLGGKSE